MSTTEVAAVVVAGASVVGVLVLALFLARLNRTVREVGHSVERMRFESVPIEARGELAPPADVRRSRGAGALVTQVARANPVLDVSQPVIKVLALASGTSRAATRFRRTRQER